MNTKDKWIQWGCFKQLRWYEICKVWATAMDIWKVLNYFAFLLCHQKSWIWFRMCVRVSGFLSLFYWWCFYMFVCDWGTQVGLFSVLTSYTYIYLNFICWNWIRMGEALSGNNMPAMSPQEVFWFDFDQRQDPLCGSQTYPPNPISCGNEPTTIEMICHSYLTGLEFI